VVVRFYRQLMATAHSSPLQDFPTICAGIPLPESVHTHTPVYSGLIGTLCCHSLSFRFQIAGVDYTLNLKHIGEEIQTNFE